MPTFRECMEFVTQVISLLSYLGLLILGRWGLSVSEDMVEVLIYLMAILVGSVGCIYVYSPEAFGDVRKP